MSKRNVFPSFAEEVRQKQLADTAEEGGTQGAAAQMKRLSSAAADREKDEVLAAGLPAWNLEPPSTPVRRRRQ